MVYQKKNNIARYRQPDENGCYKFNYNRESIRDRMVDRISFPCIKTAVKYGFTEEDLKPVWDRYIEILNSGVVPSNTYQKRYKKKEVDILSDITETDMESDSGYSSDSSFF